MSIKYTSRYNVYLNDVYFSFSKIYPKYCFNIYWSSKYKNEVELKKIDPEVKSTELIQLI